MRRPPLRWSQTREQVRLVLDVPGLAAVRTELEPASTELRIVGKDASGIEVFHLSLDLYAPASPASSTADPLWAVVVLFKEGGAAPCPWPRLTAYAHSVAPATITSDWSHYVPEPGEDYDDENIIAVDI